MVSKIVFLFAWLLISLNSHGQKYIQISNPSATPRQELISIPYAAFSQHFGIDTLFTIKDKHSGIVLAHQIERLGTPFPQNVLIQIRIDHKQQLELLVVKETPPPYHNKTYARYVPERFDDYAWENDVVAFRMYGKALEGKKDDAQGMDYWAKRTPHLIINKWYKENDYHKDHGEGQDYYSVGQTLGAGDLALFYDHQVQFTKHYRAHQVLDNGPLRTTFRLTYDPEHIHAQNIALIKTISIDAGQHFNKIQVELNNKSATETPVVLGIARRGEESPAFEYQPKRGQLAYWEPAIGDYGQTGIALIVPKGKTALHQQDKKQFLLSTTIKTGNPFTYYSGAAWNKAGQISTAKAWFTYVAQKNEQIRKPLKITLK